MNKKILMALALVCTMTACNSDDDQQPEASVAPGVEVCIVFAPNELGDQGYADRVLTGMHQFDMQLSEDDFDRVHLRYIAVGDTDAVKNELLRWDQQGISPYNGRAYERRLMVMTDACLLPYLADTPLGDTDEVLVMNVANQQFDQMPEARRLGSRLHLLSISAAEAARKLCRHIDYETSHPEDTRLQRPKIVSLFQIHNPSGVLADSIAEVIANYRFDDDGVKVTDMDTEGLVKAGNNAYTQAYWLGCTMAESRVFGYAVCSLNTYNTAILAAFHIKGMGTCEPTFLDTEIGNSASRYPTIIRHYDRALCQWLQRWLSVPVGAMPEREWHGTWDGFTTDNISEE